MRIKDRASVRQWDQYKKNVLAATPVDNNETAEQQRTRMARLLANPEEWFKYYFPNYSYAEPAAFHKKATKRWLANDRWYEVRAWSRELAKSTRAMMEDLYLLLNGKARVKLLVSFSHDNACQLLMPYRINLEFNQRIINDYGTQRGFSGWEDGHLISKTGFAIKALGAGMNPRGSKNEQYRPDIIDIDDIDTDEDCRNENTVKNKWNWIEQALIPTVSVSGNKRIRFNGNIIAKDCCIVRAIKRADYHEIINIRDKNGKSSWAKNSEKDIDYMLSKLSYISSQKEYFNNPIVEGTVFREMHYKVLPKPEMYRYLVCYIDLSYKSSIKNDYKAAVLMGKYKNEYHIHKCFVRQCTTRDLVVGLLEMQQYAGNTNVYYYAEQAFLLDIVIAELNEICEEMNTFINIIPDARKKPDKFHRIESNLEPVNTNGRLWLNEREKQNPHMQILDEQFRALQPGSKAHDDGPDAAEGGKWIIDSKEFAITPVQIGRYKRNNNKRF